MSYLSRDKRRAQLLELGLRLFSRRSYDDVSIDDIAEEAGVSRGLMYHYFGGKRALYTEVIRHAAQGLVETLAPDLELSPVENLTRGLERYLTFVEERAEAYLALMHGGLGADEHVQQILEDTRRDVVDDILVGLELESSPPAPLRTAARSWLGAVEAAALDWLAHRDVARPMLVAMLSASLATQLVVTAQLHDDIELPEVVREQLARLLGFRRG